MAMTLQESQCERVDVAYREKMKALKSDMVRAFMEGELDDYWALSSKMKRLLAHRNLAR
jgi:hypothetical protein